jgi:hypothetical protein
MKYELYAVEVLANSNPMTYELVTRINESGPGSPLAWPDRPGAEKYIETEIAPHCGAEPDAWVVPLTGETDSENEDSFDFLTEAERASSVPAGIPYRELTDAEAAAEDATWD